MMDCTQARDRLSEYQDGALDAVAAEALAVHMRGCGECAGCAGSLLAVRELLRGLPPDPAPPELLARVLAAVEAEDRDARADGAPGGADATRPFLSRFRIPLEAAAAVLLFASIYWYQRAEPPMIRPPSSTMAAKEEATKARAGRSPAPVSRPVPKTAKEEAPVAATTGKARTWTAGDLPAAPAIRASSDSERIVPVAPPAEPGTKGDTAAGAPAFEERRRPVAGGSPDSLPPRVFAAPPSRLFRPLPYGREIMLNVAPEDRGGAEERIAAAALRLGGIVERIERGPPGAAPSAAGTVRVILPESAATRFLEEMDRIGTIPPEGKPAATDLPAGPRPGTVAYAVRIRVR
ncbi:MAG: zf-HC2 domain-containing protein [bacterium]